MRDPDRKRFDKYVDEAVKIAMSEDFGNRLNKNGAQLAEIDRDNILNLAGVGVMRLTMAGLRGKSFVSAVSLMLADRKTTVDDVVEMVNNTKGKSK